MCEASKVPAVGAVKFAVVRFHCDVTSTRCKDNERCHGMGWETMQDQDDVASGVHEPPKAAKEHRTSIDMLCALTSYSHTYYLI